LRKATNDFRTQTRMSECESLFICSLSVYPVLDKRLRENHVVRDNLIDLEQDRHM